MRLLVVHTCPLVEVGGLRYIFPYTISSIDSDQIVGWVNVFEIEIFGEVRMLLDAEIFLRS